MTRLGGRATFLLIALALVSACSSEPAAPVAAVLEVNFATSATDDGAVLFTVSGGPVDSVEAPGYRLYTAQTGPTSMRVVVAGDLRAGTIARIHIADSRKLSQYSATIDQVAARGSYLQRDPVSYSLMVAE
ncbi:MAG TPA: hypothetical protein VD930_12175 [Gemmatimonadales bacterium]|nr:hypothetical protein [Gemmatimonadales bacterium]